MEPSGAWEGFTEMLSRLKTGPDENHRLSSLLRETSRRLRLLDVSVRDLRSHALRSPNTAGIIYMTASDMRSLDTTGGRALTSMVMSNPS
ncbi:hypothetical protein JQ633_05485 [Bradyrhizobium tropiciagri]|uniref:hypothetical protein n=1 Tax=Bradyrhizobium tropiciagri TaxID=312253 RepID=UPI001BA78A22|nr:hypothetical protein [Bradyrhizobium tropiciagri]MBR0869800.1 hypothetical protein [Bradyrhizobium tropiciagri]